MAPHRKVGYRSPPEHSRFQKGKSGNPTGRRKKSKRFDHELSRFLDQSIAVTLEGKKRKIPRREILLHKTFENAARGDAAVLRLIANLDAAASAEVAVGQEETVVNSERERTFMKEMVSMIYRLSDIKEKLSEEDRNYVMELSKQVPGAQKSYKISDEEL